MTRHKLVRMDTGVALAIGCLLALALTSSAQTEPAAITIRDACDPGTFTAAVGPGTCIPGAHGRIKFNLFIQELQEDHIAGAWRFNPLLKASTGTFRLETLNLAAGQGTVLQNKGGETHTFTRVANFGGGVVLSATAKRYQHLR